MTTDKLVRASTLPAIESKDGLLLLSPDGSVRKLEGDTAALAIAVLGFCSSERTRDQIVAHVESLAGEPIEDVSIIDDLVALLRASGALRTAPEPRSAARAPSARLLLGMGGAIAASHAPMWVQTLQARGFEVRVAATENALRFVAKEALEVITHRSVISSMWQRDDGIRAPHIELAEWPDIVLLWPATAAMVHRIATGDCSELVSAIAIATRAPVLIGPSMNAAMLGSPSVQRNLEALKDDGFHLLPAAHAHEVAHAPDERVPMLSGAPSPDAVARLSWALLRSRPRPLPRDASGWEDFHRRTPEHEHVWFTDGIDPQIAEAIETHCRAPGLLWDIGTGHGACARWAAERGFHVVATDVSPTALERARRRAGSAPITFVVDDVTRSALTTEFDVVVDRGTLHALPLERRADYARHVSRATRPGAIMILKAHTSTADPRVLSHPMTPEGIAALFGSRMELVHAVPGTFSGTLDPAPASIMCVLRRI